MAVWYSPCMEYHCSTPSYSNCSCSPAAFEFCIIAELSWALITHLRALLLWKEHSVIHFQPLLPLHSRRNKWIKLQLKLTKSCGHSCFPESISHGLETHKIYWEIGAKLFVSCKPGQKPPALAQCSWLSCTFFRKKKIIHILVYQISFWAMEITLNEYGNVNREIGCSEMGVQRQFQLLV